MCLISGGNIECVQCLRNFVPFNFTEATVHCLSMLLRSLINGFLSTCVEVDQQKPLADLFSIDGWSLEQPPLQGVAWRQLCSG